MPYLNFETDERRRRMRKAIEKITRPRSLRTSIWNEELCADEKLIQAYLRTLDSKQGLPLHVRRTLHQFYSALRNTDYRDQDQVVYRYTKHTAPPNPQIFMVDQLWLWIISSGKISKPKHYSLARHLIITPRYYHH